MLDVNIKYEDINPKKSIKIKEQLNSKNTKISKNHIIKNDKSFRSTTKNK